MKLLRRLALLCGMLVLLAGTASAYTITDCDLNVTADKNGACRFDVDMTLQFDAPQNEFSIPLGAHAGRAEASGYAARTETGDGVTSLVFENEAGFSGTLPLHISYRAQNAVTTHANGQTLTLELLSAQAAPIEKLSFQIALPAAFEAAPQFTGGYLADSVDNYIDLSVQDGTITGVMRQPLMEHDTLAFSLELPSGYFSLAAAPGRTVAVCRWILLLCFPAAFLYWFFLLRYPLPRPARQSNPPAGTEPGAARYVLTGAAPDLALMCAGWAAAGYLTLRRRRDGKVVLSRQMDMGNERPAYEARIFARLFGEGDTTTAPGAAYDAAQRFAAKQARLFWTRRLYIAGSSARVLQLICLLAGVAASLASADLLLPGVPARLVGLILLPPVGGGLIFAFGQGMRRCLYCRPRLLLAAALAAAVCIAASVLAGTQAMILPALLLQLLASISQIFGPRRSRNGLRLLEQLLGYRRYLRAFDAAQAGRSYGQYFYQTLPWAQALGLGGRFAAAFERVRIEPCAWFETDARDADGFYARFTRCIKAMHGADRPSVPQRIALAIVRRRRRSRRARRKAPTR